MRYLSTGVLRSGFDLSPPPEHQSKNNQTDHGQNHQTDPVQNHWGAKLRSLRGAVSKPPSWRSVVWSTKTSGFPGGRPPLGCGSSGERSHPACKGLRVRSPPADQRSKGLSNPASWRSGMLKTPAAGEIPEAEHSASGWSRWRTTPAGMMFLERSHTLSVRGVGGRSTTAGGWSNGRSPPARARFGLRNLPASGDGVWEAKTAGNFGFGGGDGSEDGAGWREECPRSCHLLLFIFFHSPLLSTRYIILRQSSGAPCVLDLSDSILW